MNTDASSTSASETISGSSHRLHTASMTSATSTVTEILTMVSASSEPMNVARFSHAVR